MRRGGEERSRDMGEEQLKEGVGRGKEDQGAGEGELIKSINEEEEEIDGDGNPPKGI